MKAHKVPATYYDGWSIPSFTDKFYVFFRNRLNKKGERVKYRNVHKITPIHRFFMEKDFYYIDFSKKGIAYKLENEITDFFNDKKYKIISVDDFDGSYDRNSKENPTIIIDDYKKFMEYIENFDSWIIEDTTGNAISPETFKADLNNYVFNKVGKIIEEDYFAYYLEPMWNDIKKSIMNDLNSLTSGDSVNLSKKNDFLEFFVIQYFRCDKRAKKEIKSRLNIIKNVFLKMGCSKKDLKKLEKEDGILSADPYYFGILLDAARGDKKRINESITYVNNHFVIDILEAINGMEFITSTNPCIFSKNEMIFPIDKRYCARFRLKSDGNTTGAFSILTQEGVKIINRIIAADTDNIVISSQKRINNML